MQRSFTIDIHNGSLTIYSDKYYGNITVNQNAISFHIESREDILKPVVQIEIYVHSLENGQYDIEVMNRTIDACLFFSNKFHEPLLQIAFRIIQEYGDLPDRCPIKKVNIVEGSYDDLFEKGRGRSNTRLYLFA